MGYDVVRVQLMEGKRRSVLQVMIDRLDEALVTLDDCEKVSHHVSAVLDVEDPIRGEYNLEVSSPGIDRPLTRLRDFERYIGHEAKITTRMPVEGRKRFRGVLVRADNGKIGLDLSEEKAQVDLAFDNVASAKLVLTDKLIESESKKHKVE